ncbi:hypothetical protein EJP617_32250 [Erwinia sp. Ejp617]|nr:hypothetical protein EJP617_32250 [Erwinia sp. Ejp617]
MIFAQKVDWRLIEVGCAGSTERRKRSGVIRHKAGWSPEIDPSSCEELKPYGLAYPSAFNSVKTR